MNKTINEEKGFVLVTVLIISMVLVIFIPTLILIMRQESRMTIKHKRAGVAFHLAEAGADRGLWKIKENLDIWGDIKDGPIVGYNFDKTYESTYKDPDNNTVVSGYYKVKLTTTTSVTRRKIISIGKDVSGEEVRSIEIIVEREALTSSVTAPSINFGGNCEVHWGPIASLGTLDVSGSASNWFPRKLARGNIIPFDPTGDDDLPNDDIVGSGNWSWRSYYNVPDPPEIDLAWYEANADVTIPDTDPDKILNGEPDPPIDHDTSPDLIYYVNGSCTLKNTYLKGTLIVIGNLFIGAGGKGDYDADVPSNADDQYQMCPGDMPGTPGGTYNIKKVSFEGFIYVGGNLDTSGGPTVNGCILVVGSTAGVGNFTVYFNEDFAISARTSTTKMTHVSWSEGPAQW